MFLSYQDWMKWIVTTQCTCSPILPLLLATCGAMQWVQNRTPLPPDNQSAQWILLHLSMKTCKHALMLSLSHKYTNIICDSIFLAIFGSSGNFFEKQKHFFLIWSDHCRCFKTIVVVWCQGTKTLNLEKFQFQIKLKTFQPINFKLDII